MFSLRVKKGKPCVSAVERDSGTTVAAAEKLEQQQQQQQHFGRQAKTAQALLEDQY